LTPETDKILEEFRRGGIVMSRGVDKGVELYYKELKKKKLL